MYNTHIHTHTNTCTCMQRYHLTSACIFAQGLDPMQLEADLELRLRHLGGLAAGYAASAAAGCGGCAAAQLVQLPGKAGPRWFQTWKVVMD